MKFGLSGNAVLVVLVGLAVSAHASVVDLLYRNNFEAASDCSSIGSTGCPGFALQTPVVQIDAGQAIAYCYYFHAPNAATIGVGRFSVLSGPAVVHVLAFTTYDSGTKLPADRQPAGTISSDQCGWAFSTNNTYARRIYQAHPPGDDELRMPSDDGVGNPLALELVAGQSAFIEVYFVNPDASPVNSSVTLFANAVTAASYTKTATYMTYDANISVPPMSVGVGAGNTCAVPPAVKFWWFSTHTHHFATSATLSDGATMIVSSSDWAKPAIARFDVPPFYTFGSGQLTYNCIYNNPGGATINSGESYASDENCVGIAYFFPADHAQFCVNNAGPL